MLNDFNVPTNGTIILSMVKPGLKEPVTMRFDHVTDCRVEGGCMTITHTTSGPSNRETTYIPDTSVILWVSVFDNPPLPVAAQSNL